jgi:hypothetical protein
MLQEGVCEGYDRPEIRPPERGREETQVRDDRIWLVSYVKVCPRTVVHSI